MSKAICLIVALIDFKRKKVSKEKKIQIEHKFATLQLWGWESCWTGLHEVEALPQLHWGTAPPNVRWVLKTAAIKSMKSKKFEINRKRSKPTDLDQWAS